MQLYSAYYNSKKHVDLVLISVNKFNYTAAFFNILWSIYKGMWIISGIIFFANLLCLTVFSDLMSYNLCMTIILFIFFGLFSDDIESYHLERNGYKLCDIILASNKEAAEIEFFRRKANIANITHQH